MTVVDSFYPFDTGPGASASVAKWRTMARLWYGSGIIPNFPNQCAPSLAGSVLTIASGAMWIDGFYGESDSPRTFTVGSSGMAVARVDPSNSQIVLAYVANQTTPTQTPTGIYEIPIARISSGAMVDIRQFASPGNTPSGVMWDFGGSVAPAGWLLCDGSSYLRTDYAGLFAAIGTTWGAADGTHFSVPDSRGRTAIGAGTGAGLTSRALATKAGEENHILVIGEVTAHSHTISLADDGHFHTEGNAPGVVPSWYGVSYNSGTEGTTSSGIATKMTFTTPGSIHTSTVGAGITASASSVGSGAGHNNMQPYIAVTKIIKT